MSEPFLGEIRMVGFNYPPRGWAFCDGQLLPINQNQSLYSILGTTYGGDGRTSFALPDLRGRTPIHFDNNLRLGNKGGEEAHALSILEMPRHNHDVQALTSNATTAHPAGIQLAHSEEPAYRLPAPLDSALTLLAGESVGMTGNDQPHENMQPYLAISFCIALQGLFPSRN